MFERILDNVGRHVKLTEQEITFFTGLLQVRKLKKHQYLIQEGDVTRFESFVNIGATRTFHTDEKGHEHIVSFGVEDWWIGDMYSFLTQTPSRYNVVAEEKCELFCMTRESNDLLYKKVPKFERFFRILIQTAYIAQQERILATMSETADERYHSFVKKYPLFESRFPQYQIASYLGIKPESLSRIRSRKTNSGKS